MKKLIWVSLLLIAIIAFSSVMLLRQYTVPPKEEGFKLTFIENNALLISDCDIVTYNLTSKEIAITDAASKRLLYMEDSLYSFSQGFVIRIDGEEVYRGVFRTSVMSAIPASPKISILFPSILFPSETENHNAIRMFFPGFEAPIDQLGANEKFVKYFEQANK